MKTLRDPKDVIIKGRSLHDIIQDHIHWIDQDIDGWKDMRAEINDTDLSYVDLSKVILHDANLSYNNLTGCDLSNAGLERVCFDGCFMTDANLQYANLSYCTMREANLNDCNLMSAYMFRANLQDASLIYANLKYVNLKLAILHRTKFSLANLEFAELEGADIDFANFSFANLRNANFNLTRLYHTKLIRADLNCTTFVHTDIKNSTFKECNLVQTNFRYANAKLIEYRKGKMLRENIIGYKKCFLDRSVFSKSVIVKLEIPKGAIVFSIDGGKCRTNKAKVLEIEGADRVFSRFKYMSYYVGDEFNIYDFNCQYNIECAEGIHFFMTREEAEKY